MARPGNLVQPGFDTSARSLPVLKPLPSRQRRRLYKCAVLHQTGSKRTWEPLWPAHPTSGRAGIARVDHNIGGRGASPTGSSPESLGRALDSRRSRNLSKSFGRWPRPGGKDAWLPLLLAPCNGGGADPVFLDSCHSIPLEVLTRVPSPPRDTVPTGTTSTITKQQRSRGRPKGGSSLHRATAHPRFHRLHPEPVATHRASRRQSRHSSAAAG